MLSYWIPWYCNNEVYLQGIWRSPSLNASDVVLVHNEVEGMLFTHELDGAHLIPETDPVTLVRCGDKLTLERLQYGRAR
jgi:hypothetical protein